MGGKGVIVYIRFIKVGLGTTKNGSVYGPGPKKNPLSPPHRMAAHAVYLANTAQKVGYLITNIMLSRPLTTYISIHYKYR
jgi:hypothetical protein